MNRQEIINKYYVTKKDIQVLLGVNFETAKKLYDHADQEEAKNEYRAHQSKVPLKAILAAAGVDYKFLRRQIEQEKTA